MPALNWGLIQDGGVFESLMHAVLYAEDPGTILFGRPGKDAGQDARTADGTTVYQAKYRQSLIMDGAIALAMGELEKIKAYRQPKHANYRHWQSAHTWILVGNFSINPNDDAKWQKQVVTAFRHEGLMADYWHIAVMEGKLAEHPEVRDVFFGGENRVLVGLKEAHDLLSSECIGGESLDVPMVGRDDALSLIRGFAASGDTRVLPLIGTGGIGKSRLLYEGLVALAQDGWRVLWGLPGTMSTSSQWFRLLNGAQQTCVALDDPDDPGLLRAVIEQLSAVERRNWRVIIACRTEKAEVLRRFRANRNVHAPVEIGPLDEQTSQALVNACMGGNAPPPWLHSVYGFTRGVPGWLCLIAELARTGTLSALPASADDVAAIYVESCIDAINAPHRDQARTLLRWLSLWGTFQVKPESDEQKEFRFLASQGVPDQLARSLMKELVSAGIVRNWGVAKRLYAVEPLIVRQQILSSWLLRDNARTYEVSPEGASLMSELVGGRIPAIDAALGTLSHLVRSRLMEPQAILLLRPIFNAMTTVARDGDVMEQCRVADLVEKCGAADPESALDVLVAIRQNTKESMTVEVPPWGPESFSHESLLSNLPWTLFQIAQRVSDPFVAGRFLGEFRQLIAIEDADRLHASSGKGARELLKRLLCDLRNSDAYSAPAYEMTVRLLTSADDWPFVWVLAECLLNPIRESMDWVANWTVSILRRAMAPGTPEWGLAADLRGKAFNVLSSQPAPGARAHLWNLLAESHHSYHRAILHGSVKDQVAAQYHAVLVGDLTTCASIMRAPPVPLDLEEGTQARGMWSWYLEYGKDESLVDLARQCEQLYSGLSPWRFHDFFRFETSEQLAPETARLVGVLQAAPGPERFSELFDQAKRYLDAARHGGSDMADDWRIADLAEGCAGLFSLDEGSPLNALTRFVVAVLQQSEPENRLAWGFVIRVCQRWLLVRKKAEGADVEGILTRLLATANSPPRLLYGLYSNVHPISIGSLTGAELDCVVRHERGFSAREWMVLLGAFCQVDADVVLNHVRAHLEALHGDLVEASKCLACFVRCAYLAALRYDHPLSAESVACIVSMVTEFQLDGAILGMHDLEWLRDRADLHLPMAQLTALLRSRIELEKRPKPGDRFEIVPYDFKISAWCMLDAANTLEIEAFDVFCRVALDPSFTAMYWMPKYIAQIDPSGQHVASFVERYLSENPNIEGKALARLGYLASAYRDDSDPWAAIARPICAKAQVMVRDDRERVYFGLAQKETGVITSMPGEVSEYYVTNRDTAARLRDSEPSASVLRGYRDWALGCAEDELRREEQRAEEDGNG